MNKIKLMIIALGYGVFMSSCGDFGDTNIDPNNPSQPDTRYFFTFACRKVYTISMTGIYNPWNQLFPQYLAERQNIQYSSFALADFNAGPYYYESIRNLNDIIKLNTNPATKNAGMVVGLGSTENQIAASRTLKAFYFMHLTDILGMLPYLEALKGDESNYTPKYDTQEFIYTDLDKELNEAYTQFNESGTLASTYDILYAGDIAKWKKFNASVRMMMAIKLSDVAPEVGKERFIKAFSDGGMTDNADRLEYKFLSEEANQNLLYENIVVTGRKDFAPSKTILDQLIAFDDPRLEAYADPNSDGKYEGIPFGITQSEIEQYKNTAVFDPRYYRQNTPLVVISPSHILLIEAEAALRGWIASDAEELYEKGIAASFGQYGLADKAEAYSRSAPVKLTGSVSDKIAQVAMQRWLGNFMQDGIEAWSDWRRLNVPALKPGSSATVTHIPYRRIYYPNDYSTNMDNYKAAVAAQGPDTFDTRVWWDTKNND